MRYLISFVLLSNLAVVSALFGLDKVSGWPGGRFVSDYFFYALVILWGLAAFMSFGGLSHSKNLRHNPDRAVEKAASLAGEGGQYQPPSSSDDFSLVHKLFYSGLLSLIVCIAS